MNRLYIPYSNKKRILSCAILCSFSLLLLMLSCCDGVKTPYEYGIVSVAVFDLLYCFYKLHHGRRLLFSVDGIFEEHYKWFNVNPYYTRTVVTIEEVKRIEIFLDYRYNNAINRFTVKIRSIYGKMIEVDVLEYFFLLDHLEKYGEEFDSLLWDYCSRNNIALEIKRRKGARHSSAVLEK